MREALERTVARHPPRHCIRQIGRRKGTDARTVGMSVVTHMTSRNTYAHTQEKDPTLVPIAHLGPRTAVH